LNPNGSGLKILGPEFRGFAENDLIHVDGRGEIHEWIGEGLRRSMLNFLEGRGLGMDVREWFDDHTPRPRLSAGWASRALERRDVQDDARTERRVVWLGRPPTFELSRRSVTLHLPGQQITVKTNTEQADWLNHVLKASAVGKDRDGEYPSWRDVTSAFPGTAAALTSFMRQPSWKRIRAAGLVLV
jgi:hypothetical protein